MSYYEAEANAAHPPPSPRFDVAGQGSRRKKLAGYLRAANEIRQSYFSSEGSADRDRDASSTDIGDAFGDATIARADHAEMILFPSYAKRHTKNSQLSGPRVTKNERDYWHQEFERHSDRHAVVDVDVRGWIYTPHKGPYTRKHRLALGALRQIAGVPPPPIAGLKPADSATPSRATSRPASPERVTREEEDLIQLETEKIVRQAERERKNAQRGVYTEDPGRGPGTADAVFGTSSPPQTPNGRYAKRLSTTSATSSTEPSSPNIQPMQKASSTQSAKMSPAELVVANTHLLQRVRPFLTSAVQNTPIKLLFYNNYDSAQQTVVTDPSGHFNHRASLHFIPTHVRILAAEKLSVTDEISITPPKGVSLISDIDDTVKHSAISMGVAEVVRNAFVRDLGELTIEGVREWYTTLHEMGVKMHYVSNSPWQMYPILASYFKLAKLPKGSFHLKQYAGLLNGIFEPVAERKKSSLDKLFRDFPERKFILVGDSGEADLEVYMDTALEHPGRVLAIFIRDVTTPWRTGYFDASISPPLYAVDARHHSRGHSGDSLKASKRFSRPADILNDDEELNMAIAASLADARGESTSVRSNNSAHAPRPWTYDSVNDPRRKPALPPRPMAERIEPTARITSSPEQEDLIDFSEPTPRRPWLEHSALPILPKSVNEMVRDPRATPSPPPKPASLRSPSPNSQTTPTPENTGLKAAPPRPRKPSSAVRPLTAIPPQLDGTESRTILPPPAITHTAAPTTQHQPSPLSQVSGQNSPEAASKRPPLPMRPNMLARLSHRNREQSSSSYGQPNPSSVPAARPDAPRSMSSGVGASASKSMDELRAINDTTPRPLTPTITGDDAGTAPPALATRRNASSYPFSISRSRSSNRLSGGSGGSGWRDDDSLSSFPATPSEAGMTKKEYLWVTRLAKAKREMEPRGVVVRTWRSGWDVKDFCVKLVEAELRRVEREDQEGGW